MERVQENRAEIEQKIDELMRAIRTGMDNDMGEKSAYRELYNLMLQVQSKFYG